MENSKWYNKILGLQEDSCKVNYRDKGLRFMNSLRKINIKNHLKRVRKNQHSHK